MPISHGPSIQYSDITGIMTCSAKVPSSQLLGTWTFSKLQVCGLARPKNASPSSEDLINDQAETPYPKSSILRFFRYVC